MLLWVVLIKKLSDLQNPTGLVDNAYLGHVALWEQENMKIPKFLM